MHIVSTFEHSLSLEYALTEIEEIGISTAQIWTIPLENQFPHADLLDTVHGSDGISIISTGSVFATVFAVLGASYGFVLYWGPIIWGIIGMILGFFLGFAIQLFHKKRKQLTAGKTINRNSEVVVIIECETEAQSEKIHAILQRAKALGIGRLEPK
jgi:hypothetical protein